MKNAKNCKHINTDKIKRCYDCKDIIDDREIMAVECEKCKFICALRYKKSNHIVSMTWKKGCHQTGVSKKYPKAIAFYCSKH